MGTTREGMRRRVQLELDDLVTSWQSMVVGDGSTTRFSLPVTAISPDGFRVVVNGEAFEPENYEVNYNDGVVTFTQAPAVNTEVIFEGYAAEYFNEEELDIFLDEALAKHNVRRQPPITLDEEEPYPLIPPEERQPLAILATIDALWALLTSSSFDINIFTPAGVTLPRDQRHRQIRALIEDQNRRYREQAQLLNIGLGRIELMPLRRKSRTTGRLVPIYVAQEFDDTRPPRRVYTSIDEGASRERSDGFVAPEPLPEP